MIMKNLPIVLCLHVICSIIVSSIRADEVQADDSQVEIPKLFDYGDYVSRYGKNYTPLETVVKSKLFFGRTIKIFQHNLLYANKDLGYFLKQNEYTDMTPTELVSRVHSDVYKDLKPVFGADKYPDMPADKAIELEQRKADVEEESSSSIEISSVRSKLDDSQDLKRSILNLFSSENINVKEFIKDLRNKPVLAEKIASMINVESGVNEALEKKRQQEFQAKNHVEYKSVVESNNKNYDPELVISYGIFDNLKKKVKENYAERMMQELDFDYDMDPFSGGSFMGEDYGGVDHPPITFENLLQSAKFIFDSIRKADEKGDEKSEPKRDDETEAATDDGSKYTIDWRRSGCITAPKAQMSCDSCYAFSVLSMMEFFHCSQTKKLTDFSPQYIVDCGSKADLKGCKGGKITNVGYFIKEHGIELSSMYPYNGRENQCPYDKQVDDEKRIGYLRPEITHWHNFQEMSAWQKWLKRSPLIVGINMPTDFPAYGGGIHSGIDCVDGMTHAMLLVGMGTENNKKFWLLKNSYSEDWGESGYFRLAQDAPLRCFNSAFVVRANFK